MVLYFKNDPKLCVVRAIFHIKNRYYCTKIFLKHIVYAHQTFNLERYWNANLKIIYA